MGGMKRTPASAFGLFQQQRAKEAELYKQTNGLTDNDLMLAIAVHKGNIKMMCEDLGVSYDAVRKRIKANPALDECVRNQKNIALENLWKIYENGMVTGHLKTYKKDKITGDIIERDQEVDSHTRMYHMGKTLQASGQSLGIKDREDDIKPNVQTNIQINIINEAKREAFDQAIAIIEESVNSNDSIQLNE